MASQRLITIHYDDTHSHSLSVSLPSAYSQLQQALSMLLPGSNYLILIESSRKLIASAKDLEAALRDTAEKELILKVSERRASERLSEALLRTGTPVSPLKAEGLEIGNRTDLSLVEAGLPTYIADPAFTRLVLQRDSLSPSDFHTVKRLINEGKSLKDVYVQHCDMSEEMWNGVLQTIGEKSGLKRLKLEGVSLAGGRFERLKEMLGQLSDLEALEITEIAVTSANLREIAVKIGNMHKLQRLIFRNTPLHHFHPLLPHIPHLISLRFLNCSHCNLLSSDLSLLLPVLINLPITRIDLSYNSLDSEACPALALFIYRCETVVEVSLEGNDIGEDGVRILNTTVEGLGDREVRVDLVGKLRVCREFTGKMRDSDSFLLSSFHGSKCPSSCPTSCSSCLLL